jgi:tripartite-type tricarboxylate transporter receptor subunit TctC
MVAALSGENAVKLRRRHFLQLAAGAATLPVLPHVARAQAYPARPVRIVVGFTPGGANDMIARLVGQELSERLGQPFVVENRPGAGSNIAAESVVRSPPDGYTLLQLTAAQAVNAAYYKNLSFDVVRDLAPVASIYYMPMVVEVTPSFPAKTLPEFIAYAKAHPKEISYGTGGIGTVAHVGGELFKTMAGVELLHVPCRGSPAVLTDLFGGRLQAAFDPLPTSIQQIKAGKLTALAVTSPERWPALPDVPTVAELLPGYEATIWAGVGAPKDTPAEIIQKLNHEINDVLKMPKIVARMTELGTVIRTGSSADFGKRIAAETEKWGKVIKSAGIKGQ